MKNLYPLILIGCLVVFGGNSVEAFSPENGLTVKTETGQAEGPLIIEVELRTNYADGVTTKRSVYETIWAMEDLWSQYADWQLVDQEEGKMVFERSFEDISPASKQNGHFGLTEDGVLTIFDGDPADEKVIQTFFQIDVGKLESQRREQLLEGIPVESWYQFEDVIQSFTKIKSEPVQ